MLDTLYAEKLYISDWPAGVPPPSPEFYLKALSASQLRALVAPYLRFCLGAMYEADLGQEDEDDDTEVEAAKVKKRKSKSKKLNDNRRTKGVIVSEPDVILSINDWSEGMCLIVSCTHVLIMLQMMLKVLSPSYGLSH